MYRWEPPGVVTAPPTDTLNLSLPRRAGRNTAVLRRRLVRFHALIMRLAKTRGGVLR